MMKHPTQKLWLDNWARSIELSLFVLNVADLMPALLEKLDEPLTDTSFLVTYLVSELAHEHVKVALSGVGGDELFGGYRRYFAPALSRMTSWMPCQWRRTLGKKLGEGLSADRGTFWGNMGRYTKAWGRTVHLPLDQQYLGLVSVLSAEQVNTLIKIRVLRMIRRRCFWNFTVSPQTGTR